MAKKGNRINDHGNPMGLGCLEFRQAESQRHLMALEWIG